MKYLKLLFKIVVGVVGLIVVLIIVFLSGESYKTTTMKNGDQITKIEIKKFFGKKIFESSINSDGFYDGPSKSWYVFKGALRCEGSYKNGYWHGLWKDYDRDGQLVMHREFNMGEPIKVFVPVGGAFRELSQDEWPKYLNLKQSNPERVHE